MHFPVFMLVTAWLLLGGCASSGNAVLNKQNLESVNKVVEEGVTTQRQVEQYFGYPLEISYTDGGLEIWRYSLDKTVEHVINYIPVANWFGSRRSGQRVELVVLFDNDNIVKKMNFYSSKINISTGLY